jgi:hypothetical protein
MSKPLDDLQVILNLASCHMPSGALEEVQERAESIKQFIVGAESNGVSRKIYSCAQWGSMVDRKTAAKKYNSHAAICVACTDRCN